MQDTELFLSLAEIAGVFVGFGALIAVRSGTNVDTFEAAYIGMVCWTGIQVLVIALAPVTVSRFGVGGHELWFACSVLALGMWWIADTLVVRAWPERRELTRVAGAARWRYEMVGLITWVPANIALVVILLGVRPDLEAALYFAAVALILLLDVLMLLMTVLRLGRPRAVVEPSADGVTRAPAAPS